MTPGGGTPYVMGDTYVPRFWPPFFTLAGSSTIFLGYFFSSTNTKTIFCGIITTNSYRIRSFRPQISFFPRSFWVQFSAASGTPPSFFGPSTPPPGVWQFTISVYIVYIDYVISFMKWSSFSNLSYPFYYAHSCIWLMKSQSCLWSRPSSRAHERW